MMASWPCRRASFCFWSALLLEEPAEETEAANARSFELFPAARAFPHAGKTNEKTNVAAEIVRRTINSPAAAFKIAGRCSYHAVQIIPLPRTRGIRNVRAK